MHCVHVTEFFFPEKLHTCDKLQTDIISVCKEYMLDSD